MVDPCVDHNILVSSAFTLGQVRPTDFRSIKRPCLWEVKCGEKKNCMELDPLPQLTKLSANRSWKNHQTIQRLDADRKPALTLIFFAELALHQSSGPCTKSNATELNRCPDSDSFSTASSSITLLKPQRCFTSPAVESCKKELAWLLKGVTCWLVSWRLLILCFFPSSNLLTLVVIVV